MCFSYFYMSSSSYWSRKWWAVNQDIVDNIEQIPWYICLIARCCSTHNLVVFIEIVSLHWSRASLQDVWHYLRLRSCIQNSVEPKRIQKILRDLHMLRHNREAKRNTGMATLTNSTWHILSLTKMMQPTRFWTVSIVFLVYWVQVNVLTVNCQSRYSHQCRFDR